MHTCINYNFTKAHFSIGVSQEVDFFIPTNCLSINIKIGKNVVL